RDHLEGKAQPALERRSVSVRARVEAGEERRHRVGVGEVELDAVEARAASAAGRVGEEAGHRLREVPDMRQVPGGYALAMPARQGTIAGTDVRCSATTRAPRRTGENQRDAAASASVGHRAGRSGCFTRCLAAASDTDERYSPRGAGTRVEADGSGLVDCRPAP